MDTLVKYRKKFKMNQTQVADAINVSRRAYGSYETGERNPSVATLIALSKLYGISLDVLTGNVTEQELFDDARTNLDTVYLVNKYIALTENQQRSILSKIDGYADANAEIRAQQEVRQTVSVQSIRSLHNDN